MFGWLKKKKQPSSAGTLGGFVRGIEHAVASAMTMYEQTTTHYLNRHLRKDGTPEYDIVKIPGTQLVLVVPKITTTHPPDMTLEEIEVKMSIRMDSADMTSDNGKEGQERHSFKVSVSAKSTDKKESNVVDLTMRFKRGPAPEGINRIIEELTKTITPRPEKDVPPPPPPEEDHDEGMEDPTPAGGSPAAKKDTTVILKPGDGEQKPPEAV